MVNCSKCPKRCNCHIGNHYYPNREIKEQFETYLDFVCDNNDIGVHLRNNYFFKICNKYFGGKSSNKVTVKCSKGKIVIEEVK